MAAKLKRGRLTLCFLLFGVAAAAWFWPATPALAAIVPCGTSTTPPCNICYLGVLVINLTNFLIEMIAFPVATLLITAGGLVLLTSGPSEERRKMGKSMVTNTVIGLVIVLLAWIAVDTTIKILTGEARQFVSDPSGTFGPWNVINPEKCGISGEALAPAIAPGIIPSTTPAATPAPITGLTCPNCVKVSLPISPRACANSDRGQICQINSDTERRLEALRNSIFPEKGEILRVTEAWPPTRTHQNPCHQAATCIDMNLTGNQNNARAADVAYVANKANANDVKLYLVYEVESRARADELIRGGVNANNVAVLPPINGVRQITAEHFSVYNRNI